MPAVKIHDRVRDLRARCCSCLVCRHLTLARIAGGMWLDEWWEPLYRDPTFDERKLLLGYCPELRGQPIGLTNGQPHECPPETYDA